MNQAISAREFSGWAEPTARRNFRGYAGVFGAIVISSTFAQLLRYLSLREIRLAPAQSLQLFHECFRKESRTLHCRIVLV